MESQLNESLVVEASEEGRKRLDEPSGFDVFSAILMQPLSCFNCHHDGSTDAKKAAKVLLCFNNDALLACAEISMPNY